MTIPAVGPTRNRFDPDDQQDDHSAPRLRSRAQPTAVTRRGIDADILAFAANRTAPPKLNDRVLYVGLNDESARIEAAGLRATGAAVTTVFRQDNATVRVDGSEYELVNDAGCDRFAEALAATHGLTVETKRGIAEALKNLKPAGARDELARVAMIFGPGEKGASIPSRLVLSGHSNGSDVHSGADELKFHSLMALARAMPCAARQVEDVHFSGCFTSEQVTSGEVWKGVFPNLKTMWGYSGFAPNAPVGHLQVWERATRGRADGDPARGLAGTAVWSARDGIREPGISLAGLLRDVEAADQRFVAHYSGETRILSPHHGHASSDYSTYRRLASRPDLSKADRESYRAKAEILYRIRFYEVAVRGEFAKEHGASIARAFAGVGLRPVDFGSLSRSEALAAIERFEQRLKSTPEPLADAADLAKPLRLLTGLRLLDGETIPQAWLH